MFVLIFYIITLLLLFLIWRYWTWRYWKDVFAPPVVDCSDVDYLDQLSPADPSLPEAKQDHCDFSGGEISP